MRKFVWFASGLFFILLLALLADAAYGKSLDDSSLTANSMKKDIEESTEKGHYYVSYILGLARGAYFSYVLELHRNGMDESSAISVADARCGRLTPLEIFDTLVKDKKLGDAPIHMSMPLFVIAACHASDVKS